MSLPFTQPSWFSSDDAGAPTLDNVAGSLLEVLRACLKNGFGSKTVTSIAVASGVATVTCAEHGFLGTYGKLVLMAGSTEPLLNGNKQPANVLTNSFTYPAPGVADGTYTGTLSAKRAPLGWTEPYSGTNKAIFARSVPEALPQMLRIVDDNATASIVRVKGVEAATGIDTFQGDFPSDAQISGGAYWQKGANTSTAKKWFLAGDGISFYLGTQVGTADEFVVYFFGDGVPYYAADAGFSLLSGQTNAVYSATPTWAMCGGSAAASVPTAASAIYAKSGVLAGEVGAVYQSVINPSGAATISGGSTLSDTSTYQNAIIHPVLHVNSSGPCVRGQMPGLAYILSKKPFLNMEVVIASSGVFLVLSINVAGGAGQTALKISEAWN